MELFIFRSDKVLPLICEQQNLGIEFSEANELNTNEAVNRTSIHLKIVILTMFLFCSTPHPDSLLLVPFGI